MLTEVLEYMALEKAIKEGGNTEPVAREAIFKMLDRYKLIALQPPATHRPAPVHRPKCEEL
ncbi:MAG: hypothetical protein MUC60_14845 [Oscillatoria sp. Prado101]|nr:hypothetical protein [Oscillatoria sp. Prado101]